jgi:hypothetical protein
MRKVFCFLVFLFLFTLISCETTVLEPSNRYTIFTISLSQKAHIKIVITDSYDNHIITLIDEELSPNIYYLNWYHTNSEGVKITEGIYFFKYYRNNILDYEQRVLLYNI